MHCTTKQSHLQLCFSHMIKQVFLWRGSDYDDVLFTPSKVVQAILFLQIWYWKFSMIFSSAHTDQCLCPIAGGNVGLPLDTM